MQPDLRTSVQAIILLFLHMHTPDCFVPASSFLASHTKSISLQAAFLVCWTLVLHAVFSSAYFPPAPRNPQLPSGLASAYHLLWLVLTGRWGVGIQAQPAFLSSFSTYNFHFLLLDLSARPNGRVGTIIQIIQTLIQAKRMFFFFSSLPNDLDNYFNSQLYFVSGALASAFCGSS